MTRKQSKKVGSRPYDASTTGGPSRPPEDAAPKAADAPSKSSQRTMTAAIAVAAVLIVGVLSVIRVNRADVEITLLASELGFTLDSAGFLTRGILLDSVRLYDLSGIRVTDYGGQAEALLKREVAGVSRIGGKSQISLGALRADRGSVVHVEAPVQQRLTTVLRASSVSSPPTFAMVAPVALKTSRVDTLRGGVRMLTAVRSANDVHMKVDPVDTASSLFQEPLAVRAIELQRLSRDGATDAQSGQRQQSMLRTIRVRFRAMESDRAVNASQIVTLSVAEDGIVRGLRVTPRGVEASFSGTVSALSFDGKSAMPTWLELFAKQVHLRALYVAVLFVMSALFAVYRWWKTPR